MKMLRLAILAAFIAIVPLGSLFAREESAGELLARHREALGGDKAVRAIGAVASTAEIEIAGTGLKGTVWSWTLKPCLSYTEISLGLFKMREGYDGERLWMVDPNGKLQFKRDRLSLEYQKTMCLIESGEYLFGGAGFECRTLGKDTANGASCEVLEIDVTDGATARLFLDDSTYLIERMEIKAPEGNAVETYRDYRRVNGVMFPFASSTEIASLGQRIETRFQSIEVNAPIDPVVFLPPASDVKDYRFAGGGSRAEAPFTYRSRHLFLPVRIGASDHETLFLLDSGASMTVIDSSIASGMGLPLGGEMPGTGAGGMAHFSMTRIPSLAIAGIEFSEQTAITFPIAGLLREFEETEVGGILGYDFLSRFTTTIDYERKHISFFEPDSFAETAGGMAIEAPLVHNIFSLPVALDGTKGAFLLDTGANSSLVLGNFAEKNGLAAGRRTLETAIRGAGGDEKAALCRFDSLCIGGMTIEKPVLAITSGTKGISALESVNGVVGNDILERFTVTLDYKKQRVLLQKNGHFGDTFYKDRAGLRLARRENRGIVVVDVISGSPSDKAGLKPGDVLLAVNGKRVERLGGTREIMSLFEAKAGTAYPIEISRAKKRMRMIITLAEYI